ncbi:MAG: hypothetical protein GXP55_11610 [Deltaproteobacteria bacterium]|nr:hypothetical protein [Deltaproteobacteria bacterium]
MSWRSSAAWALGLSVAALGLAGCRVDRGVLDEQLFSCDVASDCGPDWGCVRASPYASDFCASDCDAQSCDGICTQQNGASLCLRSCRIQADGSTSECPSEGLSCIRTSTETDDGVCYPVDSCNTDADCPDGGMCLGSIAAAVPGVTRTDNFYCVPRPKPDGTCPLRSVPTDIGVGGELCLATCMSSDTRCPPSFGCLTQLGLFGSGSNIPCFPGFYGTPCDDDTNCLLGRCLDTGDSGRQCSIGCDEATRLYGGCDNLLSIGSISPSFSLECDASLATGDTPGGLCVTHYGVGFPCASGSDAFPCAEGLSCTRFSAIAGDLYLCTKRCLGDRQCNSGEAPRNYCFAGYCFPKGDAGARCTAHGQCLSHSCVDGVCVDGGAGGP